MVPVSRCKRLVIIVLPFNYQLKTRFWYVFSYATKETNTHRSSLSTRHSSATMCILPTMLGRWKHTTVCMLEQFQRTSHCNGSPWNDTTRKNKINDQIKIKKLPAECFASTNSHDKPEKCQGHNEKNANSEPRRTKTTSVTDAFGCIRLH